MVLPASCVSVAVAAGPLVATTAAATPAHGALTASGAFHGTWHQHSVRGQCTIEKASHEFGVSINLYYGVSTDSATGKPVGGYPALSVTQLNSGSTHNVNLEAAKNFNLELTDPSGSAWQSGWGSHSGSPPPSHGSTTSAASTPTCTSTPAGTVASVAGVVIVKGHRASLGRQDVGRWKP